uniref:Cyanobacterial aminoacyl-tRNA synthetase CAAD domain-containing protein n=2 Tax=Kalanchoe fedtschenkoi TaxID=63787 RepID=A0A7N0VK58_KALFE
MASIAASLCPLLMVQGGNRSFRSLQKLPFSPFQNNARQGRMSVVAKAAGESSDSSTSLSVIKSVKSVWDAPEDRFGVIGLGLAAIIALWASTNLITAIDKLPILPSTLEFIGILFSSWFVYRYLLFKPNRVELVQIINKAISDILGQKGRIFMKESSLAGVLWVRLSLICMQNVAALDVEDRFSIELMPGML